MRLSALFVFGQAVFVLHIEASSYTDREVKYMAFILAVIVGFIMIKAMIVTSEKGEYSPLVILVSSMIAALAIGIPEGQFINSVLSGVLGTFTAVYIQEVKK